MLYIIKVLHLVTTPPSTHTKNAVTCTCYVHDTPLMPPPHPTKVLTKKWHTDVSFSPPPPPTHTHIPSPSTPPPSCEICHKSNIPTHQLVWVCRWCTHPHPCLLSFHVEDYYHLDLTVWRGEKGHHSIHFWTMHVLAESHVSPHTQMQNTSAELFKCERDVYRL